MEKKPLIYIAVTNQGTIHHKLADTLIKYAKHPKYDVRFFFPNIVPLDASRNTCVENFIKISNHEDDRLFFVDDDMDLPLNGLDVLIEHDKDIVAMCAIMVKPDDRGFLVPLPVACRYNSDKQYIVHQGGTGLTEVDAVGGANIMIKRKVFETIGTKAYEYDYYMNGTLSLVADYKFCQKAQDKGFKVYVDYDCVSHHYKEIDLLEFSRTMQAYAR